MYFVLNEKGEKVSNPFKASLFGKNVSYKELENHFKSSKENLKTLSSKTNLKQTIELALNTTNSLQEFKDELLNQGINVVLFQNKDNRIYGVTFIDHNSKSVYKGSNLSKELSANTLNKKWSNVVGQANSTRKTQNQEIFEEYTDSNKIELHSIFEHLNSESMSSNITKYISLFNLLDNHQEIDYEELIFEQKIKLKKKKRPL